MLLQLSSEVTLFLTLQSRQQEHVCMNSAHLLSLNSLSAEMQNAPLGYFAASCTQWRDKERDISRSHFQYVGLEGKLPAPKNSTA